VDFKPKPGREKAFSGLITTNKQTKKRKEKQKHEKSSD
jgi:hypothetical protein